MPLLLLSLDNLFQEIDKTIFRGNGVFEGGGNIEGENIYSSRRQLRVLSTPEMVYYSVDKRFGYLTFR